MKIIFFTRLFYPHIGGVEKHVYEISKILIAKGHNVTIVTEQHDISLKEHEIYKGIHIYRISVGSNEKKKKFMIWRWMVHHRNLIREADVVHCHDVFFWYLPFRFLYPKKKVFITFHGYESFPLSRTQILMHKLGERLTKGNICIGDFIQKWYGTKPTYISYGGVTIPTEVIQPKKKQTALFIGRLDEQTNIREYNNAFVMIKKKFPQFELTVAGDGPYHAKLDRRIKVLGFIEKPEILFKDCTFAFSSRYLAILEAMAAKRLVFAIYDTPIKKDYLELAPFAKACIITNSSRILAEQVMYYLTHKPAIEKKIQIAFRWVKEQTWEHVAEIYLNLWKKNT